jgi:hypothetical protein
MSLIVTNEGANQFVGIGLNNVANENLLLKLYTDGNALSRSDNAAARTECVGNGYAAITLTKGSWSLVPGVGNNPDTASYAQQTFTFTGGPVTVNGYYVVGATSGKLYWEEVFSSAAAIPAGGGSIKITPQFQLQ